MTKFEKIKKAVATQKENKIKGESRRSSLLEEKERLFENLSSVTGKTFTSKEEAQEYVKNVENEIAADVERMAKILDEEGIDY